MVSILGKEVEEKTYDVLTIWLLLSGLGLIFLSLFFIRVTITVSLIMVSIGYVILASGIALIYIGHDYDDEKDDTKDRDRN